MLAELTAEEFAAGLDAVAVAVLQEAGIHGPPVDALAVARALGIAVTSDGRQAGRGRYVRLRGAGGGATRPAIFLRPDPREERLQWAAAHEIGEHAAWRVFRLLGIDPRETAGHAREQVANQLAGRLLLPTGWFAADAADRGWDLFALKSRYPTASHELIARRTLELPPPAIVTIFDQGRLYLRRSNLPGHTPPPSSDELRVWHEVHHRAQPSETCAGPHTVRGWPIHEPGWKREILRTALNLYL